jgi:hypothetical protein
MRSLTAAFALMATFPAAAAGPFRAGAAAVDITPPTFPVVVNGMFEERTAKSAADPLHARGLVLDDGKTRVAIVIVDSCMMPRVLLDKAKALIQQSTGIPTDRVLIAATHTHSAPSVMGCLGSRADQAYIEFLVPQLVRTVELAARNLAPAQVGWAVVQDPEHTFNRRWIRRPDRLLTDPFGEKTVRANMHPGYLSPDVTGVSGPVDPGLSVLAVRTPAGRPLAVLANYSMHYYGSPLVSADYFGRFADEVGKLLASGGEGPPFVGIMSQGTSGDLYRVDYSRPQRADTIDEYTAALTRKALESYRSIRFQDAAPITMRETTIRLRRRVPDAARLAKSKAVADSLGHRPPKTREEIYAVEQIYLDREPERELKLQALKIGDLGIAAIPNEVFALTGLKIKAQSPLEPTFTIELANGAEGYIPPPEQHALGGYTTWPARTAALDVRAEPRIVEAVLKLLEEVAGQPRRKAVDPPSEYSKAVLASKPVAYWRLDEMGGDVAHDASGNAHDAAFDGGHAFYLDGPRSGSHAVHFAGGQLNASFPNLRKGYTVEMWCWNGLPAGVRPRTGSLILRGGNVFGLGGATGKAGRLFFLVNGATVTGVTEISPRLWYHVALEVGGLTATIYVNGKSDGSGALLPAGTSSAADLIIGSDGSIGWEGKLAEIAVYDRLLLEDEIAAHYRAARPAH